MTMHTTETLNAAVDFDVPFRVSNPHPSGQAADVERATDAPMEPSVYIDPDDHDVDDVTIEGGDDWEPLTGFTGQHGYNGAVMHPSEFLGGGLAAHVLSNPGVYVVVEVGILDYPDDDGPVGWAILRLNLTA